MQGQLKELEQYWSSRAEGYSMVNQEELAGEQREKWLHYLRSHFPDRSPKEISVLDVGTGPGFFAIILAEAGYRVTAVDYTAEMLKQAQKNAGILSDSITWMAMDAQHLTFEDDLFDVIVTRNLTWNLDEPDRAYREWHRVLKPGGTLLNFDANWYAYLFDEEKRRLYEEDRAWEKEYTLVFGIGLKESSNLPEFVFEVSLHSGRVPLLNYWFKKTKYVSLGVGLSF